MGKIKIGYFADGPWSYRAFERIIVDKSIEIAFIVPRTTTNDNVLKGYSEEYSIDYFHPVKVNSDYFIDKAVSYECDLFVSMSYNQIFKNKLLEVPNLGIINCHAGKLPFYRGRNVLNWALINDEKEFGVTVHFVDEGIDTGDIILQECFPITDKDDYGSLLNVAYKECARLLHKALKQIQAGTYNRTSQEEIHPIGFVCGRRGSGDELIDWNNTSRDLFNFIRALSSPGPIASTTCRGDEVKINRSKLIDRAPVYINTPGQLLSKTERGFIVKTSDSFIEIFEIDSPVKLRVGDKLGS